jgi:hypothetical protein
VLQTKVLPELYLHHHVLLPKHPHHHLVAGGATASACLLQAVHWQQTKDWDAMSLCHHQAVAAACPHHHRQRQKLVALERLKGECVAKGPPALLLSPHHSVAFAARDGLGVVVVVVGLNYRSLHLLNPSLYYDHCRGVVSFDQKYLVAQHF